ncbi:MAG: PIN domain-containing protein, partial [Sulfurospirillum sp.]|nr:PIN domain-containing protein [Sulfurospirillum sp.]
LMKYFIDTNIIIDLLNKDKNAQKKIKDIISKNDIKLFINRLVRMESLRTFPLKNTKIFKDAEDTLESFEQLEIKPSIYEKSINFSRYCKSKGINLKGKCEAIDYLHFMTAKHYGLKIVTNDKDFEKLKKAYSSWESF